MDTDVIMENDEIIETTEKIVDYGTGYGLGMAVGAGLVLVGAVAYIYGVKPMLAKIKAKKEKKETNSKLDDGDIDDEEESDEENE